MLNVDLRIRKMRKKEGKIIQNDYFKNMQYNLINFTIQKDNNFKSNGVFNKLENYFKKF